MSVKNTSNYVWNIHARTAGRITAHRHKGRGNEQHRGRDTAIFWADFPLTPIIWQFYIWNLKYLSEYKRWKYLNQ